MKKAIFLWLCFLVALFSCKSNNKLIYENIENNAEITLVNIDEISDNISVLYKYNITRSGLYILNEAFELDSLYMNNEYPFKQYISLKQFDNILFFRNSIGSNNGLLFDLITENIIILEIDEISHIRFVSKDNLIIYGTTWHHNWNGNSFRGTIDKEEIIEIEFINRNTSNENIGINIYGEYSWEKQIECYVPPINYARYQTEYMYKIFDKYIIIYCGKITPEYSYINLGLHYIEQLNKYIFWVDNFGTLE